MEIRRRTFTALTSRGTPIEEGREREYIFFNVEYNHFRDTSDSDSTEIKDKEEIRECECVLCLPKDYSDTGAKTQLILSFHGAGGRVCEKDKLVGGVSYATTCIDNGFAVLDVCGSEPHGLTMGCPEHLFAIYKAYRYAISHYNLYDKVLIAGASMGGHVAMNFINTFPSIVIAAGLFYPRLNMDGVTVNGHYCIGTWDKTTPGLDQKSSRDRIVEIYRFEKNEWCEKNTVGFNPYRTRSFIDQDGNRVVIPPCPIKIWQGRADTTVDPVMVEEFVRSVKGGGCYIELRMLDGVAHRIVPPMKEELALWFGRFV